MGWLFRRSFKIFPGVRINLGKKGISSVTVGKGPFSSNINTDGVRHSVSVPGTGLRYQTERSSFDNPQPEQPRQLYNYEKMNTQLSTTWNCDNCSTLNPEHTNFCGNCGYSNTSHSMYRLPPVARVASSGNLSSRDTKIVLGIIGGVLAFMCLVCVGLTITPNRSVVTPVANKAPMPKPSATNTPAPAALVSQRPAKNKKAKVAPTPTPDTVESDDLSDSTFTVPSGSPTTRRSTGRTGSRPVSTQSGYIRGPRGGCYYMNSRGNKTYVDRSLCN